MRTHTEYPAPMPVGEVAEILGQSPTAVRRLIASGRLRAVNVASDGTGRRYRVARSDLQRFIAESIA